MTGAGRSDEVSADRQALLELLLADEGIELGRATIDPRDRSQPPVLSYAQERMWFLDQFESDNSALPVRAAIDLRGPLNVDALKRGLDEIVDRHAVLRTLIVSEAGQPRPVVLESASMPLLEIDIEGDHDALEAILKIEATRTFELSRHLPIHVTLVRIGNEHHVMSVVMHHVASDGSSFAVFFRELQNLYGAFCEGRPSPLAPLPIQYEDYASWQRDNASDTFGRQLDYWREQLRGPLPTFELPPDHRRPARHTFTGGKVAARIPDELSSRLTELCRLTNSTLFMVLLAGFEIVASRHAGQTDVIIGAPIAGRIRPELEPMIGAFLNTIVLRTDLEDQPTFRTLVERVRDTTLGAFDNQDVPFELLLQELKPPRDISRTPVFQVMFNMTHIDVGDAITLPGLRAAVLELPDVGSKFDMTMYVNNSAAGTMLGLVYNTSLFDHAHMERFVDHYIHVLEQVTDNPDQTIDELSLVTDSDARLLPDVTTPLDRRWHGSVPDAVRRAARRDPNRLAAEDVSAGWSYVAFATHMTRLAAWLRVRCIGRGDVVAIYGHRSAPLVWTVTGVLASEAVYLLIDPRYPPPRLVQLLRIARPKAWIALEGAGPPPAAVVDVLDELGVECRLTVPNGPIGHDSEHVLAHLNPVDLAAVDELIDAIRPDDAACLTFTSGSTGVPKAVVGRHGSLTHFLPWMSQRFGVGEDDRFSMLSGLAHDPLQRDMFWPLWLGATIVVPEQEGIGTPGWLATWLRDQRVSVAHLTPAMGQLVTEGVTGPRWGSLIAPDLRVALFIGDVLTRRDVSTFREVAPNVLVVNMYGTTETQRASGYHVLDDDGASSTLQRKEVLPLGTGMPGAQLLVRNASGGSAAIGEIGEIAVRSPHLAIGYFDDEALTAARFERDPHGRDDVDQLYATGDRGRYRFDGSVEFLGRDDEQVQLRGYRIELDEVAAAIRADSRVADAVVRLRADDPEWPRLVAYVVPERTASVDERALIQTLRTSLPAHMVPSDVVFLERLPLSPNGKLDWRALPAPDQGAGTADGSGPDSAGDTLERMLVDIWKKVLGRKQVGVHDDFFALGGYSLLATRLFALVEERTGLLLPVSVLFEHPTIAALAAVIRQGGWRTDWSSLVPIQPAGAGQPFFYVSPYLISVLELAPLGDELGRDRPLYGLQPRGLDGSAPPHTTIEDMAAHYIAEIKTVQPDGPYALGGHCSGSWVAFEMARQFEAAGEEISALALIDQGPPGVDRPAIKPLPYLANRVRFYFSGRRLRDAFAWQFKIMIARVLLRRVGTPTARFTEAVKEAHRAAYRVYRGGRVTHDITLVLSADSLSLEDKRWYTRWSELTDGEVTTRNVGGTHANLLMQPYVRDLATEIAALLDSSDVPRPDP